MTCMTIFIYFQWFLIFALRGRKIVTILFTLIHNSFCFIIFHHFPSVSKFAKDVANFKIDNTMKIGIQHTKNQVQIAQTKLYKLTSIKITKSTIHNDKVEKESDGKRINQHKT